MIDFKKFNSLFEMTSYFKTDAKYKKAIIKSRWSDGDIVCPFCGKHHCKQTKDGRFHCTGCNHNFSCLHGTIFDNTKMSLRKWFIALYMVTGTKKSVSAH